MGPGNKCRDDSGGKLKLSRFALATFTLLTLAWATLETAFWSIGPPPLGEVQASSTIVVDRKDRLLRAFTTPDGRWRLPVERSQVDERYLRMLLAYEDRRFHAHHGIDPVSIARAAVQIIANQRIVSGANDANSADHCVGALTQVRTSTRGGRSFAACARCSGRTSGPQPIAWITRHGPR